MGLKIREEIKGREGVGDVVQSDKVVKRSFIMMTNSILDDFLCLCFVKSIR